MLIHRDSYLEQWTWTHSARHWCCYHWGKVIWCCVAPWVDFCTLWRSDRLTGPKQPFPVSVQAHVFFQPFSRPCAGSVCMSLLSRLCVCVSFSRPCAGRHMGVPFLTAVSKARCTSICIPSYSRGSGCFHLKTLNFHSMKMYTLTTQPWERHLFSGQFSRLSNNEHIAFIPWSFTVRGSMVTKVHGHQWREHIAKGPSKTAITVLSSPTKSLSITAFHLQTSHLDSYPHCHMDLSKSTFWT